MIYWSFQLYNFITEPSYPNFKWATICICCLNIIITIHYLLSLKYLRFAFWFTNIQTVVYIAGAIESARIGNPSVALVDVFSTLTTLTASVSIVSYCQKKLFFSYCVAWIYTCVRTYFWYYDNFRWLRFNLFQLAAIISIYIFSRAFQSRDRVQFE